MNAHQTAVREVHHILVFTLTAEQCNKDRRKRGRLAEIVTAGVSPLFCFIIVKSHSKIAMSFVSLLLFIR